MSPWSGKPALTLYLNTVSHLSMSVEVGCGMVIANILADLKHSVTSDSNPDMVRTPPYSDPGQPADYSGL
jgi:hypothetical protein